MPPVVPVRDDPADHREEQDGELAEEVVNPQVELGARQVVDEQALSVFLHPGADGRAERGEPEDAEIAVGQGPGHPGCPRVRLVGRGLFIGLDWC